LAVEGFSKADFWIWMSLIFAVNAGAAAALGAPVLAAVAAVTAFSAAFTAAMLGRAALEK